MDHTCNKNVKYYPNSKEPPLNLSSTALLQKSKAQFSIAFNRKSAVLKFKYENQ